MPFNTVDEKNNDHCSSFNGTVTGKMLYSLAAAANVPHRNEVYAQMVHEVIQKTSECHSAECRHNTRK
jgi:hypothetical protein